MKRLKKCTEGNCHTWKFVKNTQSVSLSKHRAKISFRGIYQCKCGATKLGVNQRVETSEKAQ